MRKTYALTEAFLSLQGEGHRAGTVNVFLRFAGCNMKCRREQQGFDCDTGYRPRVHHSAEQLVAMVFRI